MNTYFLIHERSGSVCMFWEFNQLQFLNGFPSKKTDKISHAVILAYNFIYSSPKLHWFIEWLGKCADASHTRIIWPMPIYHDFYGRFSGSSHFGYTLHCFPPNAEVSRGRSIYWWRMSWFQQNYIMIRRERWRTVNLWTWMGAARVSNSFYFVFGGGRILKINSKNAGIWI